MIGATQKSRSCESAQLPWKIATPVERAGFTDLTRHDNIAQRQMRSASGLSYVQSIRRSERSRPAALAKRRSFYGCACAGVALGAPTGTGIDWCSLNQTIDPCTRS
jgi:hypothetical protein